MIETARHRHLVLLIRILAAATAVFSFARLAAAGLATTPAWTIESNQANAQLGRSVAGAGDVNGDGWSDVIVGAWFFTNGQAKEGRAIVFLGSASGLSTSPAWAVESNQANAQLGVSVAAAGDVNGDGYGDVIVGANLYDNGQSDEGAAWVYLGSATGLSQTAAWSAEGNQTISNFGRAVAPAGDVNADGYDDVLVGAKDFSSPELHEGRAFLYLGGPAGLSATPAWISESNQASSEYAISHHGAGDVNGDGFDDVIVGADEYDAGELNEGRAWLYLGSAGGLSTTAVWTGESNQGGSFFGVSVAGAGDVNGDGYADLLIGASNYEFNSVGEGRIFLYYGSATGPVSPAAWTADGRLTGAALGTSVAAAGDVNGDGYADILAGAYLYANQQANEGAAYLFLGSAAGPPAPLPNWTVESNQAGALYGWSVAGAGDVDANGFADLLVGAYRFDNVPLDEGSAFLYAGAPGGLAATPAWTTGSGSNGYPDSPVAGDFNADGFDDLVISRIGSLPAPIGASLEVYAGSAGGPALTLDLTLSPRPGYQFIRSAQDAVLDADEDGYDDLTVAGSPVAGSGNTDAVFVYRGTASGLDPVPAWQIPVPGPFTTEPGTVAAADLNQDGYPAIISRWTPNQIAVFLGGPLGPAAVPAIVIDSPGGGPGGFGAILRVAGDVNADGYPDILAAEKNPSPVPARVFLFLGSPNGLSPAPAWKHTRTPSACDVTGASAGDVNGDGFGDIFIGEPCAIAPGGVGAAYVYFGHSAGPSFTPDSIVYGASGEAFGTSGTALRDVNGDGFGDLAVGAQKAFQSGDFYGRVDVFAGSPAGLSDLPLMSASGSGFLFGLGLGLSAAVVDGVGLVDLVAGGRHPFPDDADHPSLNVFPISGGFGLPVFARQTHVGDGIRVPSGERSDSTVGIELRSLGRSPAGRDRVTVEAEIKPLGTPFDGAGLTVLASGLTGVPGAVGSVLDASVILNTLAPGTFYHWRVRSRRDWLGNPVSSWTTVSPRSFSEAHFRTAGCADRDSDGRTAPPDALCPISGQVCLDSNVASWATPGEARQLLFSPDRVTLSWVTPIDPGGSPSLLRYDVVRSPLGSNFVPAVCVEANAGPDTLAIDMAAPVPGGVFYYLVRARNGCPGPWASLGATSAGVPRVAGNCP
jgi:hypothetical protein